MRRLRAVTIRCKQCNARVLEASKIELQREVRLVIYGASGAFSASQDYSSSHGAQQAYDSPATSAPLAGKAARIVMPSP